MRKLMNFMFIFATLLFLPISLNAQYENKPQKSKEVESTDKSLKHEPIDMSHKDQDPDEQTVAQFKTIADKHAKEIGAKLNLNEDDVEDIRESIMDYFDDRWESRVELSQERGDKEETRENEEDLADERVEVVEEIEDELDENQINQWNQMKVEWWTSLDKDFFKVKTDGDLHMDKKEMKDHKDRKEKMQKDKEMK